jgi:agmatinase
MSTINPSSLVQEQTYTAAATFIRTPAARDAAGADAAILGIPFDIATTNRPGTRFGPGAIRAASAQLAELKSYPHGIDPKAHVKVVDLGDVYLDFGNPLTIPSAIEAAVRRVVQAGALPISLGGDHFVTYPILRAVAEKHGPLAMVHFDAHPDTWEATNTIEQPVQLNHGTMFHRAVAEGVIVPADSVQLGIRTWVDDTLGITVLDNVFCDDASPEALAEAILAITKGRPTYLTIDIDSIDPAFAPGTGTPVAGGFTPLKLLRILRALDRLPLVGFDLVEVSPAYDTGDITALLGATIVYEQLVRLARLKGAEPRAYPTPRF